MLHGSDLPVPSNGILPLLGGMIDGQDFLESRRITNPIEKDARLKQMLGYDAESFTRAAKILRIPA
jgi:hypothetical protein